MCDIKHCLAKKIKMHNTMKQQQKFPLNEVGYMDRATPFSSLKDQIFR